MRILKNHKSIPALLALLTSASVLVGGLFTSPDELINDEKTTLSANNENVYKTALNPDDELNDVYIVKDENSHTASRPRNAFYKIPLPLRAIVGIPLWTLGHFLISAISSFLSAFIPGVVNTVISWILCFAIILGVVVLAVKSVFPDIPVKKILNRKTMSVVLIGVVALSLGDTFATLLIKDYSRYRLTARFIGGLVVMTLSIFPIFRKHRKELVAVYE